MQEGFEELIDVDSEQKKVYKSTIKDICAVTKNKN